MKISFNIGYNTRWGETLHICGSLPELGGSEPTSSVEMKMKSPGLWSLDIEVADMPEELRYFFIVRTESGPWRFEWGAPHRLSRGRDIDRIVAFDSWHDMPADKPYYSSAFVDGMLRRNYRDQPLHAHGGTVQFRVSAPMVLPDEVVAISGEGDLLGNWDQHEALILNDANYPEWEINVPLEGLKVPFEYKFVILKRDTREIVAWETCANRIYGVADTGAGVQVVVDGIRFANPRNDWRGAGTAIPVFSLRSEEDFGVGDFLDLKKMVEWCARTGQKVLQLLPVNDTTKTGTWIDSYPYSANSAFALHPMYIRPEAVGRLHDKERRDYYRHIAEELNALPQIDYERVTAAKEQYLRDIFAEQGSATLESEEFAKFYARNEEWLKPYAAWRVLCEEYRTPDNSRWGEYSMYEKERIDAFADAHRDRMDYHYYVQYHLDRQLREAREYAHLHGVVLKGDIPIGIGRESVDAWRDPRLYNMDCQAGAPPDDFSVLGQNWGFPTYNWEEMARDGFAWWKSRFRKMAEYFDAYRIDHILGFFRIWQIPLDALHGLLGYFNPALPYSPEELRNNYDFWIDTEVQTRPLILEWMLTDFFGEYTDEVKEKYLIALPEGRYRLKEEYDTQVKVRDHFTPLERNEKNTRICNALMGLIDDVLFIEDPYKKGHYHPRIAAQFSYQYRNLNDYEKWCFNRLYNDFYYHRHNDFWYGKAMWKLPPLIDSTSMLCCAEDLGMIPDCVPAVMHDLEILSLEIQRMPKNPKHEFGDTWHYPYFSVCTTSTHDMPGIRAWWESNREATQKYFNHVLHEGGEAPYYAEPWICGKILDLHLKSPSMLCIIPLQDWLSADGALRRQNPHDEQINEPADAHHYWRYRMHLTLEQLNSASQFNNDLRDHIKGSGR